MVIESYELSAITFWTILVATGQCMERASPSSCARNAHKCGRFDLHLDAVRRRARGVLRAERRAVNDGWTRYPRPAGSTAPDRAYRTPLS